MAIGCDKVRDGNDETDQALFYLVDKDFLNAIGQSELNIECNVWYSLNYGWENVEKYEAKDIKTWCDTIENHKTSEEEVRCPSYLARLIENFNK